MNDEVKEHWFKKGSSACLHKDVRSGESATPRVDMEFRIQTCSEGLLTRSHVSAGSIVERDWLCYKKNQGNFYCFYCKFLEEVEIVL